MSEPLAPTPSVCLVDKPPGPTSHDVVASIRRRLPRGTRVGHAGTLDPFATGLLVVAIGRATRIVRFLTGVDKTYRARVALGTTSVTGDPEGPTTVTGRPTPAPADIRAAVVEINGHHMQTVPAYAAVKVDGERLYRRARRGEQVERPIRPIEVRDATTVDIDPDGHWVDIALTCSSGTYVRQIAADLGDTLGCGAYCEALRRTHVGALSVESAVAPEEAPEAGLIDLAQALSTCMPLTSIDADEARALGFGQSIRGEIDGVAAATWDGEVVAVVTADGVGNLRPTVVLR